jgi:DNA polymerase-3 subunit epsilon
LRCIHAEFKALMIQWSYDDARIFDPFELWRTIETRKLADAVERWLGRKATKAHRALEDAEDARDVLLAQIADPKWEGKLPKTAQEIHDLCFPDKPVDAARRLVWREGVIVCNFGKHKGLNFVDALAKDRQYFVWVVNKGKGEFFTNELKSIIRDALAGRFPQPPAQKTSTGATE